MKIILIRHGATESNLRRCYLGSTDQPLLPESAALLASRSYPEAVWIAVSPMLRCRQTAEIIYGSEYHVYEGLKECDFGEFENKNHRELSGDPRYQKWLASGGELPFPGGEDPAAFAKRVRDAFLRAAEDAAGETMAVVAHGGTFMALLREFMQLREGEEFLFHSVKNGGGLECEWTDGRLAILRRIY